MKMTKEQLRQFEEVLIKRGYKYSGSVKANFEWFNNIIKEEDFKLCVVFYFFDIAIYENNPLYQFPFNFHNEVVINDNTIPTYLNLPFFGHAAGNELFSNFNRNAEKEGEWYTVRNAGKDEINDYIAAIEETAYKFNAFYHEHLKEVVFKNFRKQ